MTFEQLKALDAVVTYGSVRAAAERIHKTAPSVSALIKNLEADIGFEVLSRENYRPKLTQQGEIFYQRVRQVLGQMTDLASLSQRISKRKELVVNIAINAVCPLAVILTVLSKVARDHPETQLNISTEHMGGAMEQLLQQKADIAITTSANMDKARMEAAALMNVPVLPVAGPTHPLAQWAGVVPHDAAAEHTQVIVRDSSQVETKLSFDVIEGARQCHVTDFEAKKKLIEAGFGWGGLPEYLFQQEIEDGRLVPISVEGFPVRNSQICAVRRNDTVRGPVCSDIWKLLLTAFPNEGSGNKPSEDTASSKNR